MTPTQALTMPSPATAAISEESLYEVVNGQRMELPPTGAFQTDLANILGGYLWSYARGQRLGRVEVEMLFLLDPTTDLQRRPDVAFVSYDRWPRSQPVPGTNAWAVVPNLAVEVVSPTNTFAEVTTKVDEYFRAGVELVWVVVPNLRQVYVYTSLTAIQVVERAGHLDGGTVLPGFHLPLTDLFEEETPAQP
jgi:Uma2 family endonuclease